MRKSVYCLKAVHHKHSELMVVEIFKRIGQLGEDEYAMQWMRIVWQYVAQAVDIEPKEIAELTQQNLSGKMGAEVMTLAQRLEQRGRTEGRTEGRTAMLTRQLTRKFGAQTLTPLVQQRLQLASTDQLDYWGERILDAQNVTEVFAEN